MTSLLQGLERRGLVERRTEGGNERSKRVYATPAGIELIAGFEAAMAAADETILAPLDQAERATLLALLDQDHRGTAAALPVTGAYPRDTSPLAHSELHRAGFSPARAATLPKRSNHDTRTSNPQ